MNRILLVQILFLLQFSCKAQSYYQTISITKDIDLIQLTSKAYIHVSYYELPNFGRFPSNGLIYINNGEAFLFDTLITDSLTKDLTQWIIDSLQVKLVGFVPNHWHDDCMGGLGYLQSIGIDSYANQMTIDIAKANGLPVPNNGFSDSLVLGLGNGQIRCYFLGAGHSLDNIVVWIPSEKILFAGCMVKDMNSKGLGNIVDGDINEWPKTIDVLIKRFGDAKYIIPGHGTFGDKVLLEHTRSLLIQ
jgi:metallo-beta-lactamase class B